MLFLRLFLSFVLLAVLAAASFIRLQAYDTEITLWSDTVAKSPGRFRPHNNLGVALKKARRLKEAEYHLRTASVLRPDSLEALNSLASVYYMQGRSTEAIGLLQMILLRAPDSVPARCDLGTYYFDRGMRAEAAEEFMAVIELGPGTKEAAFARKMLVLIGNRK